MGKRQKVQVEVPAEAGTQPFVCYFPTGRPADADDLDVSVYASASGRVSQHVLVGSRVRACMPMGLPMGLPVSGG